MNIKKQPKPKQNKKAKPKQTRPKDKETNLEKFRKSAKCNYNHSSPMSDQAWTDLNSKCDMLKLHDMRGKKMEVNVKKKMFYS